MANLDQSIEDRSQPSGGSIGSPRHPILDQLSVRVGGELPGSLTPTLAAWLANVLVRTDPDEVNDRTELGNELRTAHISADGARLRQFTLRRHDLVEHLVKTARSRAKDCGRTVGGAVADRLAETLDAALIDPGAAQFLRSGRLTSALRHVGFGVVDERAVNRLSSRR